MRQRSDNVYKVGFLGPAVALIPEHLKALREELLKFGFAEGRNLIIDHRPFDDPRGPAAMATELARSGADVFVAYGPEVPLKALVEIRVNTPIVFVAVNFDPVARGYVASLARPGGNVTGVYLLWTELPAKQLEVLTLAFPDRKRIGILWDVISADQVASAEKAAASMKLEVIHLKLEKPPYDFAMAIRALADRGAQSLMLLTSPHFIAGITSIAHWSLHHRLPTMFTARRYVEAGGLMSYGSEAVSAMRRASIQVAKILNGAKPTELPIEQSSAYELVVNLKTSKALGITIPPGLLSRADYVFE